MYNEDVGEQEWVSGVFSVVVFGDEDVSQCWWAGVVCRTSDVAKVELDRLNEKKRSKS